ncbi:MAG: CaiB/BaiF CoA transferase family protein [Thermoplasmata archaeon]
MAVGDPMHGPMDGMRVLDLSRLLPGGLVTQLLADLGAEVIKVEEPGRGDYLRDLARTPSGRSPVFFLLNQGKKSIALNLKRAEGREILHRLIPTTDVLLEQFRPGVAGELGVDYETARALKKDLVYCSLSGFGAGGPYRNRPGHDLNFMALAGGLHPGGGKRPVVPPVPAADITSGFLGAFAILAALLERNRSGEGHFLDLSLFDAALYLNAVALAAGETFLSGGSPGYGLYEGADGGFLSLGALEKGFWRRLSEAIGRPDLADTDLERDRAARRAGDALRSTFAQKTIEDWDEILRRHDVPAAPVVSPQEVREDPHVQALGLIQQVEVDGETLPSLAHPARWSGNGPRRHGTAPRLGEHTAQLLREAGYEASAIARWARDGVLELGET